MFRNYFECLDIAYKLEKEGLEIKRYKNDFIVKSYGYEIARITNDEIVMPDVNYLLFEEDIDEITIKDVFYDYNKLIDFVLNNVCYES